MAPNLLPTRDDDSYSNGTCIEISVDEIVFSRTTFFVVLAVCVATTGISLLAMAVLGYREWKRQREERRAREYGRVSRYQARVSMMRKEVDDSYSRQYSGCLINEPENPFLAPRSPVELMHTERVSEVPANHAASASVDGSSPSSSALSVEGDRARKGKSLLFDNTKARSPQARSGYAAYDRIMDLGRDPCLCLGIESDLRKGGGSWRAWEEEDHVSNTSRGGHNALDRELGKPTETCPHICRAKAGGLLRISHQKAETDSLGPPVQGVPTSVV
ncbi:hypothetical protein Q7P37_005001 [Cladosporium fusiforme]